MLPCEVTIKQDRDECDSGVLEAQTIIHWLRVEAHQKETYKSHDMIWHCKRRALYSLKCLLPSSRSLANGWPTTVSFPVTASELQHTLESRYCNNSKVAHLNIKDLSYTDATRCGEQASG